LLLSKNKDVRIATTKAIMQFAKETSRYDLIDQRILLSVIEKIDLDFDIYNIIVYISHQDVISTELSNEIIRYIVTPLFEDSINDYSIQTDMILDKTLDILASNTFKSIHPKLKSLTVETVRKIINKIDKYHSTESIYGISKRRNLVNLIELILSLDTQAEQTVHFEQLMQLLEKGNINQQSWAIYLLADLFYQNNIIVKEILKKVRSPDSQSRISALSVLHKLDIPETQAIKLRQDLRSALEQKSWLKKTWGQIAEIFLGVGFIGDTIAERIQIAGMLAATDNSNQNSIKNLANLIPLSSLYKYRYEWSLLLVEIIPKLSMDDIESVFSQISKIVMDEDKDDNFVVELLFFLTQIHTDVNERIKDLIIDLVFTFKNNHEDDEVLFYMISLLHPRFAETYNHIDEFIFALSSNSYFDANAAYEMLEENSFLVRAIYSV
jgi:hypothetical protein